MARFVLLSFDDNAEAEQFVESFRRGDTFFSHDNGDGTGAYGYNSPDTSSALAVFMKPTQFCPCYQNGTFDRKDGFSKGKKYGLWVHKCGKPSRLAWDDMAMERRLNGWGTNLIRKQPKKDIEIP